MRYGVPIRRGPRGLSFWLFSVILAGCGGGGGESGSGGGSTVAETPRTGTVTFALTDAAADDFSTVQVQIDSLTLLGPEGEVPIPLAVDEPLVTNLLDLQGVNEFFAQAEVPVGTYTKIRLQVSNPYFVLADGTEVSASDIKLVANGVVDLNPQGPFVVEEGGNLIVQLDFDVGNSIHVEVTGNGKYILRPQIFVDVLEQGVDPPMEVDVQGEIHEVHADIHTIDVST